MRLVRFVVLLLWAKMLEFDCAFAWREIPRIRDVREALAKAYRQRSGGDLNAE